jgi:DNA-binding PadR family transcriptional regulator
MSIDGIALTEAVYYVLLSLGSPLHGYGIMQNVEGISGGRVRLAAGTLYGALGSMLDKGWIRVVPGEKNGRKIEYEITESGKAVAARELDRLKELVANGERAMGGNNHEKDDS